MIKKCPKCGAEYPEKLLYCVNCGKKLVYEFSEYANYEAKESSNKWKWVAAIVAIATILIGGGAFLFFKMNTPKFACIINDEVTIHDSPSISSQVLMTNFENEGSWNYCWAYDTDDKRTIVYRDNCSIVQVMSKQDDWYKVRFYPDNLESEDGKKYIEGWISSKNLENVEPIQLTWDNIYTIIENDYCREPPMNCHIVDDSNVRQTIFIQYWWIEEGTCMFYGKADGNHLNIYGSRDDLKVPTYYEDDVKGISIEKDGGHNVLHYGYDVASDGIDDCDSHDVDVRRCTPQMREQIFNTISNKPYSRRYYFNLSETEDINIRSFEIIY